MVGKLVQDSCRMSIKGSKVCIITIVHPPFDTRIFHKEAKTLVEAGYDVTLVAQHDGDTEVEGIRIIGLPKPRNRFTRIFGLTWLAFRLALREKADVYHFHDPELLLTGVLLKLFAKGKVIYDVHEDVPAQIITKHWLPTLLRRPLAAAFDIVEKLVSRAMDAVVTATEGIAEKFQGCNPIVIHNFPNFQMLPNPVLDPKKNEKILIYVGGLSKLRGAVEMVRALEYLAYDDLWLHLIGKFGPSELEQELQALPGYQRVLFLGWMEPKNVYTHLTKADIGLVCLHPEPRYVVSLPVKLFEYMAVGLPVIASNFPLWKEIIEGNKCGLTVDPLDPKEIAQAIEYLLEHPEERKRMGENGRRAVEEKYNWEIEGQKLLKLYEELLKQ